MLNPQIIAILDSQNPWHRLGHVPERLAPPRERVPARWLWKRHAEDLLYRYQIIVGPRRTGKTVTMYHTVRRLLDLGIDSRRLWWVSLDHPLLALHRLDELVQFVVSRAGASADRPAYLFLDELVYADQWDLWLKQFYDQRLPVRVMASSSAASALRQGRLESGVGRWEEIYLGPCQLSEALDLLEFPLPFTAAPTLAQTIADNLMSPLPPNVSALREMLLSVGGYPELLLWMGNLTARTLPGVSPQVPPDLMEKLRSDGMERVVYRDIQQSPPLARPLQLEKLVYLLADRTGGVVSASNLAQDLAITAPTVETYLGHLERAFMVFPLLNYSSNESVTQRRGRKYYLIDPALRSAILQHPPFWREDPSEQGKVVETLAASHLHTLGRQEGVRAFHWRYKNRFEVDLVYDHPRAPLAFEVSLSRSHDRHGLRAFMEQNPRFKGQCYVVVARNALAIPPEESRDGIGELPLDLFLMAVGRQHDRAVETWLGASSSGR